MVNKSNIDITYLQQRALQINENDATLDHDSGIVLSHELIHNYGSAMHHWLITYKLDSGKLININKAIKYCNISFKIIYDLGTSSAILQLQQIQLESSYFHQQQLQQQCQLLE